jgi:hypothetical protein
MPDTPAFRWLTPQHDIHLVRGTGMTYPLRQQLEVTPVPGGPDASLWARPLVAGPTAFAPAFDVPDLLTLGAGADGDSDGNGAPAGHLRAPADAPLGSFLLQLRVVMDGEQVLDRQVRRVHIHEQLTALWLDPPRVTARQGHRLRPRVMAVFDDPDGDRSGPHATAVELTDRAYGRYSSYTREFLTFHTGDAARLHLIDPTMWGPEVWATRWEVEGLEGTGQTTLRVAVRPERAEELGLPAAAPGDQPLLSDPIEVQLAPAFDQIPEEHRRIDHVAGAWPDAPERSVNLLFLLEGLADDADGLERRQRIMDLLGGADDDDSPGLLSPMHAPWNQLLEDGLLNIFLAHLPSPEEGLSVIPPVRAIDPGTGQGDDPYQPSPGPLLHDGEDDLAFREVLDPHPAWLEGDDHDPDHVWRPGELLTVVGWPHRADRDADWLTTIEAWHERFHGGPIPPLYNPDAADDQQPVRRAIFDAWRSLHEQAFVQGVDNAFGMQLGSISSGGAHQDHDMPWFGHYATIDHINTYLSGLLPPADMPDGTTVDPSTRWMNGDQAGPDRAFVYLLGNGVPLRGYRQPADDVRRSYMVSSIDEYTSGKDLAVVGEPPAAGASVAERHTVRLVPRTGDLPERAERDLVGTVVHELHHALGLGDEYEETRQDAEQADTAINLVRSVPDNGGVSTDGADLIQRGVRWDIPRVRWAERVLEVELPGDGTIHVSLPDRGEVFRPPADVLDHLRLRRGLRRYDAPDDRDPPAVSDRLQVDQAASTYPDLVLVPAPGGGLPDPAALEDRPVLFVPVLLDEDDPDSLASLLSAVIREHLVTNQTVMNPGHACDASNPVVTNPRGLPSPIRWLPSPSRIVGLYLGGGRTPCGAVRPTGISRMRTSHSERPAGELYPTLGAALNLLRRVRDVFDAPTPWGLDDLRTVLPLSVVEAYIIADVIDPFQLAQIDRDYLLLDLSELAP